VGDDVLQADEQSAVLFGQDGAGIEQDEVFLEAGDHGRVRAAQQFEEAIGLGELEGEQMGGQGFAGEAAAADGRFAGYDAAAFKGLAPAFGAPLEVLRGS